MDADAAKQAAPELPAAAHPGPQFVGEHVLLRHDQPIDIGDGTKVALGELLGSRHKRCPHCSEGWVHRPRPDGTRVSAVCGCCVQGWRTERARAVEEAARIPVASLAWQEKARKRVERLARDLAGLEDERAERVRRFDEDNAELLASARSAAASAQDEFSLGLKADREAEHLRGGVADAEKTLARMRAALGGAEAQSLAHRQSREIALAMQQDAEQEIERRRGGLNLGRLDRDIAKLRRRLTGARIYGGVADAAPATEGA
jgi:hypothetical protein